MQLMLNADAQETAQPIHYTFTLSAKHKINEDHNINNI